MMAAQNKSKNAQQAAVHAAFQHFKAQLHEDEAKCEALRVRQGHVRKHVFKPESPNLIVVWH